MGGTNGGGQEVYKAPGGLIFPPSVHPPVHGGIAMAVDHWIDCSANRLWNARKQISGARYWAETSRQDPGLAEDLFQIECWLDEVVADLRARKLGVKRQLTLPIT